jgi:hypothetical protein
MAPCVTVSLIFGLIMLYWLNLRADETTEKLFGLSGTDFWEYLILVFAAFGDGFQLVFVPVKIVSF